MPESLTLLQGTVDLLILQALSFGPNHGYGVSLLIRQRTEGALMLEEAAFYQSLHRLERQRLVRAEWGLSENNRKAKFYQLTAKGRQQLRRETSKWEQYADAVSKVLRPAEEL